MLTIDGKWDCARHGNVSDACISTGPEPAVIEPAGVPSPVVAKPPVPTGATVDFLASAVVFASAALHTEVMPQSPQTKPASTIASALVKSD